jgi:cyclic beta-1,2-glucan synthetase
VPDIPGASAREFNSPHTARPEIAILGRAPFTTVVTNAGGGQTRYGPLAVTRWRADPTLDDSGHWCYVKDITADRLWSTAYQPTCAQPDSYKVVFEEMCASFRRRDGEIETLTEILASPDDPIEIRKVTLTNLGGIDHTTELTSCVEPVIATFAMDRHHPVFSNLFVQTEWLGEHNAILAMRRPRSALADPVWCGHSLCFYDETRRPVSCETDRMEFIGRGRSYRRPAAMNRDGELSGRVGAVLDPVFALRTRVTVPAGNAVAVAFATFIAKNGEEAARRSQLLGTPANVEKIISAARIQPHEPESAALQQIAARLLFPSSMPAQELGTKEDLEFLGLTGDAPIIVAHAESEKGRAGLEKVFLMQRYLDLKGIPTELVVLPSEDITERQLNVLQSHAQLEIDCESFDLARLAEDSA